MVDGREVRWKNKMQDARYRIKKCGIQTIINNQSLTF